MRETAKRACCQCRRLGRWLTRPQVRSKKRRTPMNRKIARSTLVILSIATLVITLAPAGQAQDNSCSTAKAAGDWGFTLSGTILLPTGPVPAAAVARGSFDTQGKGNATTATEARNVGGDFANETVTASWTVDSDCTGTLMVNAYEAGVLVRISVLSLVFVDNMREVLAVQQSLTLPGGATLPVVITATGKRVFTD